MNTALAATLEQMVRLLEGNKPQVQAAKELLNALLEPPPCANEKERAAQLIGLFLTKAILPSLEKGSPLQREVEKFYQQITQQTDWDGGMFIRLLRQIAPGISATDTHPIDPDILKSLPNRLANALLFLAKRDPWMTQAINALPQVKPGDAIPWEEWIELFFQISQRAPLPPDPIRQERNTLKNLLADLANDFQKRLQELDRKDFFADSTNGRAIAALCQSNGSHDLEELKKMILYEARTLKRHVHKLRENLQAQQDKLSGVRECLRKMDDDLLVIRQGQHQDPLTGLPNRFAFSAHFGRLLERMDHLNEFFALLLFRIEGLPELIEAVGRDKESQYILGLMDRLKLLLRPEDFLARLNQESFIILFPKIDQMPMVLHMANKISARLAMTRLPPMQKINNEVLRTKIGYAAYIHQTNLSEEELLHRLNKKAQEALDAGSGTVIAVEF
ncbi:MAG: diguanylate cyclase [Magnetococcus sp. DMHC-6]